MRVILTGPGGSGKSSVLENLAEQGHMVIEECARYLITHYQQESPEFLPWNNRMHFQNTVEAMQIANFCTNNKGFFDRGLPDEIAYRNMYNVGIPDELIEECHRYRYDHVFIFQPWEEIYQQDSVRIETFDDAKKVYDHLCEGYNKVGYAPTIMPMDTIEGRARFILSQINL